MLVFFACSTIVLLRAVPSAHRSALARQSGAEQMLDANAVHSTS
jgi:hypothetical protein